MTEEEKKLEQQTDEVLVKIGEHVKTQEKKNGEYDAATSDNKLFMEKVTTDLEGIDKKIESVKTNTDRLEKIEKKVNFAADHGLEGADVAQAEMKALNSFLRTGRIEIDDDTQKKYGLIARDREVKIMSVSDDPDAGYLKKPPTYLNEIIKHMTEFSPVRQLARVFTTDKDVYAPKRTAVLTASNRSEKGSMTEETTRKYGQEIIVPHEITARVDAYFWMIEDSAYNLAGEAQSDAAESFAFKEGSAFVNGTGLGEAQGFMQDTNITSRNQEEADTLTDPQALMLLAYDINDQYTMDEANCAYMMRRATLGLIRTMTAGDGHFYLQLMDERGKRQIEGFQIATAPDMDAVGANTYPVIFGNFRKGYWIVDRLNMWILRDPFTHSDDGYETFKYRRRTGGQPVQPLAFKKLKIAVT